MFIKLVLLAALIIAAYTDLRERKVSNKVVLTAFILTVIGLVLNDSFPEALIRAIPAIIFIIFFYITNIGGGDTKLLILLSLAVDPVKLFIILVIMFMVGVAKMIWDKLIHNKKESIPLIPGMLIGYLITIIVK